MTQPAAVNVPVIGTVQRRWLYVGVGAVVVVVGVAYWRRRREQAAAATFDPATGSPADAGLYVNPVPGAVGLGAETNTGGQTRTNAEWAQECVSLMSQLEWNGQYVAAALGKYLAGARLNQDELNVVRTAWALKGKPPQGAPEPVLEAPGQTPSPTPQAPTTLPAYVNVFAGQVVDDWVGGLQAAGYKAKNGAPLDWASIVSWNSTGQGIMDNVTPSTNPRERKFRYNTAYRVTPP